MLTRLYTLIKKPTVFGKKARHAQEKAKNKGVVGNYVASLHRKFRPPPYFVSYIKIRVHVICRNQ